MRICSDLSIVMKSEHSKPDLNWRKVKSFFMKIYLLLIWESFIWKKKMSTTTKNCHAMPFPHLIFSFLLYFVFDSTLLLLLQFVDWNGSKRNKERSVFSSLFLQECSSIFQWGSVIQWHKDCEGSLQAVMLVIPLWFQTLLVWRSV